MIHLFLPYDLIFVWVQAKDRNDTIKVQKPHKTVLAMSLPKLVLRDAFTGWPVHPSLYRTWLGQWIASGCIHTYHADMGLNFKQME